MPRHPDAGLKRLAEIQLFKIGRDHVSGRNKSIYIMIDDIWQTESVSWVRCCSMKRKTNLQRLNVDLRTAVVDTVQSFKQGICAQNMKCAICGSTKNLQVDHVVPFRRIRDEFVSTGLPMSEWKRFHDERAALQMLCAVCNNRKSDSE